MSCENPTGEGRFAALDLPPEHVTILRSFLSGWLEGLRSDLATPERLEDADEVRREAQAYERLLVGLTLGQLFVPDSEAEASLRAAVEGYDTESHYAEIAANHEALHRLLAVLDGGGKR